MNSTPHSLIPLTNSKKPELYLLGAFVGSLFVHILLAYFLLQTKNHPPQAEVFNVTLAPDIVTQFNKRKLQLVSPSAKSESSEITNTRFRSGKDSSVLKEQIRRGDGREYGQTTNTNSKQATPRKKTPDSASQSKSKISNTKSKSKKLDLSTDRNALRAIAEQSTATTQKPTSQIGQLSTEQPQPFSRAANQGARFIGRYGVSDYIPELRDGDITLLNTKAAKYAVFVRRVAIRVFHLVKEYGWSFVRGSDYYSLNDYTVVRAIMDSSGELINVKLEQSSGSANFDEILKRAVKTGAADPHPPAGARTVDGNIHFIFLARSWTKSVPARNGISERRWLVLKTGLE